MTPERVETTMRTIHNAITTHLTVLDGHPPLEDEWDYAAGDGGGISRIWEESSLIERGGVNFSAIHGEALPEAAATQFSIDPDTPFFATGVSLVVHPWNPHVPTIHMNVRYFEAGHRWWFGGGIDLTPYYPVFDEVAAFHRQLKRLCDSVNADYETYKRHCDDYFHIRHRGERRGVGGIFFDHLQHDAEAHHALIERLGMSFGNLYRPFVDEHRHDPETDDERFFQLYRRGRYVEFNLVYDRGTKFGLQSSGRIESILMSMPGTACWRYDWEPEPGSPEELVQNFYLQPQDWLRVKKPRGAE